MWVKLEDFPQVGGKKIWITTTPSVHVYIWSIFGFSRRYSPSKSPDVWVLLLWKRYKVGDCEFTTNPIPLCFHQVPTYCHIQSHGNHTVFHVCNVTMFRMLKFFGCQKKVPNFGTMWPVWWFFGGWSFWDISSSHIRRLAYKMCIGCSPLREKSDHQDYSICRTPLLTFTFHFCWVATPEPFIGIETDLKISPGQSCVFCGLRHLIQRQAELPSKFPQVPFLEGWRKLGGNVFYEEKDITKMTKNEREVYNIHPSSLHVV